MAKTPHVGKELAPDGEPTLTETILAAGLAFLFLGIAIYAAVIVGGFGWAVAVVIGFLGVVAAGMAVEQTRNRMAIRKAESISVEPPQVWPSIGSPGDTDHPL